MTSTEKRSNTEIAPIIPVRAVLLSIVDDSGRFFMVPPPQEHQFQTALGKWDLLSVEPSPDKDPLVALNEQLWIKGIQTHLDIKKLGVSQTVKFYPDRNEYRSTRREFYAARAYPDRISTLLNEGLVPVTAYKILKGHLDYRNPGIEKALKTHMGRLQNPSRQTYPFYTFANDVPLADTQGRRRVSIYLGGGQYD